jgi:hypothetical protein
MDTSNIKDPAFSRNSKTENEMQSINPWRYLLWMAVLTFSSMVFSLGLACATPLAAFGAAAAVTFGRRDALLLSGAVWFVNQCVGYAILWDPPPDRIVVLPLAYSP